MKHYFFRTIALVVCSLFTFTSGIQTIDYRYETIDHRLSTIDSVFANAQSEELINSKKVASRLSIVNSPSGKKDYSLLSTVYSLPNNTITASLSSLNPDEFGEALSSLGIDMTGQICLDKNMNLLSPATIEEKLKMIEKTKPRIAAAIRAIIHEITTIVEDHQKAGKLGKNAETVNSIIDAYRWRLNANQDLREKIGKTIGDQKKFDRYMEKVRICFHSLLGLTIPSSQESSPNNSDYIMKNAETDPHDPDNESSTVHISHTTPIIARDIPERMQTAPPLILDRERPITWQGYLTKEIEKIVTNDGKTEDMAMAILKTYVCYDAIKDNTILADIVERVLFKRCLWFLKDIIASIQLHDNTLNPTLLDILGKKILTLQNERKPIGTHRLFYQVNGIASGTYFCVLKSESNIDKRKVILIK